MKQIISRSKKAVIIAFSFFMMFSAVSQSSVEKPLTQSWFITGSFLSDIETENEHITVVYDDQQDIEFSFGIFDFFKNLFS